MKLTAHIKLVITRSNGHTTEIDNQHATAADIKIAERLADQLCGFKGKTTKRKV